MRQILILAICILTYISCGQISQDKKIFNEPVVYELINDILKTKEPIDFMSCDKIAETSLGNFIISNDFTLKIYNIDTLLTKEDKSYALEQFKVARRFRINKDSIKSRTIIPWDTLQSFGKKDESSRDFWKNYELKYGTSCFCSIALPIFSIDKLTAIVTISRNCGSLNGYGGTYLYRKINGKWTNVQTLESWIS
jgi:hypothetical protein